MPQIILANPTLAEIIEGKIKAYLSSQQGKLDSITRSQTALQDQVNELKTGLESQITSLGDRITNVDNTLNTLQSLRPFLLGMAIAVGVILLAILVLLILVKVSQAKEVTSQKEKLKAVEETSQKNKKTTTDLGSQMAELQKEMKRQYEELTKRLDKHDEAITKLNKPISQNAGNPASPAQTQTPQQFLAAANAAVANRCDDYYGPVLAARFQIRYFNRVDPVGQNMAGRVEEAANTQAFFCGVEKDGQLLLIPNHPAQNLPASCVSEFFDYLYGHNRGSINLIESYAVLTYEQNSGFWVIRTKGRIR